MRAMDLHDLVLVARTWEQQEAQQPPLSYGSVVAQEAVHLPPCHAVHALGRRGAPGHVPTAADAGAQPQASLIRLPLALLLLLVLLLQLPGRDRELQQARSAHALTTASH